MPDRPIIGILRASIATAAERIAKSLTVGSVSGSPEKDRHAASGTGGKRQAPQVLPIRARMPLRNRRNAAWLRRARMKRSAAEAARNEVAEKRARRTRTTVAFAIVSSSLLLAGAAYLEYRTGTPSPYELPDGFGQVHLLLPKNASDCRGGYILDASSDSLQMRMSFSAPKNGTQRPPVIGFVMDWDAQPPDYYWPLPPETLSVTGSVPDPHWYLIAQNYGFLAGHLWLLRAPAAGNEYSFTDKQPASLVGDGRGLQIDGELSNKGGHIEANLNIRSRTTFRDHQGSRATYRLPALLGFEAVPKFTFPGFDDPNTVATTGQTACGGGGTRHIALLSEETLPDARVDPSYRIDSVSPSLSNDTLIWSAEAADATTIAPIVSLVNRNVEQRQQRSLFLSGVFIGIASAALPVGLPLFPWARLLREPFSPLRLPRSRRRNRR